MLTLEEWVFVGEYLKDGNASRAIRVAGYDGHYAGEHGYQMLKRPHVAEEITRGLNAMREQQGLTKNLVIEDIVNVLRADPRDLIQFVTGSCRYCHGVNHEYQRTIGEYKRDKIAWLSKPDNALLPFPERGGVGFNAYRDPHASCPECNGRGVQMPQLKDTRTLSPETAALYNGIKVKKDGSIEILTRSKDAAREAAAKYLGMNTETVNLNVKKKVEDYTDEELIELMKGGKQ